MEREKFISKVTLDGIPGRDRRGTWGRKEEEYVADFCLVSRRSLSKFEYQIFNYHFLLGADWKLCCRKLNIDRGSFYHTVYKIEQRLGRVYRELQPYGLYPLQEYFSTSIAPAEPIRFTASRVVPIRPPLAQPDQDQDRKAA